MKHTQQQQPTRGQATPRRALAGGRRTMMRIVDDIRFGTIAVYEEEREMPGRKVLTFDSMQTTVRLTDYPHNWHTLPPTALLRLVVRTA